MAQSELKIVIGVSGKGAEKYVAGLVKDLNNLDKTTKSTKLRWTEFSSALGLAKQGFQAIKRVYDDVIGSTIKYADQVCTLSRNMNISTEEASRLIQVSDDYKIEVGELTGVLKIAQQKGFLPTIDNLATLADLYNSTQDPLKRTALLTEKFGRNWTVLTPLLAAGSKAIRDNAAAIESGLVLNQKQVDAARDYEIALDKLNDRWLAFKISVADKLIPEMIRAFDDLARSGEWFKKQEPGKLIGSIGVAGGMSAEKIAQLRKQYGALMDEQTIDIKQLAVAVQDLGTVQLTTNLGIDEYFGAAAQASNVTQTLITGLDNSATAFENVQTATENLRNAQQNWNDTAGGDIANLLSDYIGKGDRYKKALEAIDTTYGTGLTTQFTYQQDLKALVEQYAHGGDVDTFKAKLKELQDKYQPLDDAVKASMKVLQDYKAVYDAIVSKSVTLTTYHVDVYGPEPAFKPGKSKEQKMEQFGGAVMVGEHGPEMFVPSYAGHIVPNNQVSYSITSNVYGAQGQSPNQIADAVMTRINKQVAAARNNRMGSTEM